MPDMNTISIWLKSKIASRQLPLLIVLVCIMFPKSVHALPEQPEYLVKSAMIFRMLKYTTWPDENKFSTIRLAFVGDEPELYKELLDAAKTIQIKGKPLEVIKTEWTAIDPQLSQIIYLDDKQSHFLHKVAERTRRTGTLLLSNQASNRHELMINFVKPDKNVLSFEVNRSNIVFERIDINRDLMLLGGTEIDVAELFRETESALQEIKQDLFEKEGLLKQTTQTLAQEKRQIEQQKKQIQQFKAEIAAREQQLKHREKALAQLNNEIAVVNKQLQDQQSELTANETLSKQRLNQLRDQSVKVAFLNEQIVEKQAFLAQQQETLESLSGENDAQQVSIISQKKMLFISLSILILFTVLILFILSINTSRKRNNLQLEKSKQKLLTLAEIGQILTAQLELDQVIAKTYQSLTKVFPAQIFQLAIMNEETHWIEVPLSVEHEQQETSRRYSHVQIDQPLVWCIKNNKELISLGKQEWRCQLDPTETRPKLNETMETIVYLPLRKNGKAFACMSLQNSAPQAYSEEQLEVLRILAEYTSIALSNALSYAQRLQPQSA